MNILTKRKKKEAKKKEKFTATTAIFCKLFLGRDNKLQIINYKII